MADVTSVGNMAGANHKPAGTNALPLPGTGELSSMLSLEWDK